MTSIGIFSDSHGDTFHLEQLLSRMGHLDVVVHLGDVARDADWLEARLRDMPQAPLFLAVSGNNDLYPDRPAEIVTVLGGKRIYMTHGHLCHVRSGTDHLVRKAREHGAEIALYGHTHAAYSAYDYGVFVINPGAAGNPWGAHPARAMKLVIDKDRMYTEDIVVL